MKKLALHWQILIGMTGGILFGVLLLNIAWGQEEIIVQTIKEQIILDYSIVDGQVVTNHEVKPAKTITTTKAREWVTNWVEPFGTMFVNLLKLIAVPLILASLIKGISDLKDIAKFRRMGIRTVIIYIATTIIAITLGLVLVNAINPGAGISKDTIENLSATYEGNSGITSKLETAAQQNDAGPLQALVDMVPDNAVAAMSNNSLMLQVIFFAIFLGISMLLIGEKAALPLKNFFDSLNDVVLKMVDLIMLSAPFAVFALLATVVVSADDPEILLALLYYAGTVVLGLVLMIGVYCIIFWIYVKKSPLWFLSKIAPAQLLAFSTSSSAATLPVTMERVEEHMGVEKEVASFVLPVGATINMDGTSLYQAVAAVFVCQALGIELALSAQLTIVLTALLASIGSAAVPGAGMVMLVIVLESINFPSELLPVALALIFAVDRPLDMLRTTVNVTGDATVASIVAKSLGKFGEPNVQDWDDKLDQVNS
jgi:Na+/H+-dicarboxylate symporter